MKKICIGVMLLLVVVAAGVMHSYVYENTRWSIREVGYTWNLYNLPSSSFYSLDTVKAAIRRAADKWSKAGADFSFPESFYMYGIQVRWESFYPGSGHVARVVMDNLIWNPAGYYEIRNPVYLEFSTYFPFSTLSPPPMDRFDVESVALHEFGHCLALEDVYIPGPVMYGYISQGEQRRSLSADDVAGIKYIYGNKPAESSTCSISGGSGGGSGGGGGGGGEGGGGGGDDCHTGIDDIRVLQSFRDNFLIQDGAFVWLSRWNTMQEPLVQTFGSRADLCRHFIVAVVRTIPYVVDIMRGTRFAQERRAIQINAQYIDYLTKLLEDLAAAGPQEDLNFQNNLRIMHHELRDAIGRSALSLYFEKIRGIRIPDEFFIAQNVPDPFSDETLILYEVPYDCEIELVIVDERGHPVKSLHAGNISAGYHSVTWRGDMDNGDSAPRGTYACALTVRPGKAPEAAIAIHRE